MFLVLEANAPDVVFAHLLLVNHHVPVGRDRWAIGRRTGARDLLWSSSRSGHPPQAVLTSALRRKHDLVCRLLLEKTKHRLVIESQPLRLAATSRNHIQIVHHAGNRSVFWLVAAIFRRRQGSCKFRCSLVLRTGGRPPDCRQVRRPAQPHSQASQPGELLQAGALRRRPVAERTTRLQFHKAEPVMSLPPASVLWKKQSLTGH